MTTSKLSPIIVSGIGRSGTSALIAAICEHKEVLTPTRIGEAPFINNFLDFLVKYEDESSIREYHLKNYKIDDEQRIDAFSDLLLKLHYGTIKESEYDFNKYWTCKVSLNETQFRKAREVFGTIRCIYIVRNGIEVVNSARSFSGFADLSFEQLCDRWSQNIRQSSYLKNMDNCSVVRHNELVESPREEFERIFKEIDIDYDIGPAGFISSNVFNSSFDKKSSMQSTADVFKARLDCWFDWTSTERDIFIERCGDAMEECSFEIPSNKSDDMQGGNISTVGPGFIATEAKVVENNEQSSIDTQKDHQKGKDQQYLSERIRKTIRGTSRVGQFNYYANIGIERDFLYWENPKVASTTVLAFLQSMENPQISEKMKNVHDRTVSPLARLSDFSYDEQDALIFGDSTYKFTFVRNPYSRLLSAYRSKIERCLPAKKEIIAVLDGKHKSEVESVERDITFSEFIDVVISQSALEMNSHWKHQVAHLNIESIEYDFIGRFETFSQDIKKVCKRIYGDNSVELPVSKNYTGADELLDVYYDRDLYHKVYTAFREDFERFEYTKVTDSIAA